MPNFWNRRKDNVTDAGEYLRTTSDVSRPIALLLSLLGFLVVFSLLFSLFLAGRWAYQRYVDDTNSTTASTIQAGDPTVVKIDTPTPSTSASSDDSETSSSSADSSTTASSDDSSSSSSSTNSTSSTNQEVTVVAGSSETNETDDSTGSGVTKAEDPEAIVSTGPGHVAAMTVAVATLAGGAHSLVSTRLSNRH